MKKKPQKPLETLSQKLRIREKRKAALMDKARVVARKGASSGWREVLRKMDWDDATSLKIWLSARDMDELDTICDRHAIRYR